MSRKYRYIDRAEGGIATGDRKSRRMVRRDENVGRRLLRKWGRSEEGQDTLRDLKKEGVMLDDEGNPILNLLDAAEIVEDKSNVDANLLRALKDLVTDPEVRGEALDKLQLALGTAALSEVPLASQAAGLLNAAVYGGRGVGDLATGNFASGGGNALGAILSVIGAVPGAGAGADAALVAEKATKLGRLGNIARNPISKHTAHEAERVIVGDKMIGEGMDQDPLHKMVLHGIDSSIKGEHGDEHGNSETTHSDTFSEGWGKSRMDQLLRDNPKTQNLLAKKKKDKEKEKKGWRPKNKTIGNITTGTH